MRNKKLRRELEVRVYCWLLLLLSTKRLRLFLSCPDSVLVVGRSCGGRCDRFRFFKLNKYLQRALSNATTPAVLRTTRG